MSDKEISAWFQIAIKFRGQLCLRRTIEVDHHVATEDQIQGGFDRKGVVHQIDPAIAYHLSQVRFDLDHAGMIPFSFQKMSFDGFRWKIPHTLILVDARRGSREHAR